MAGKKQAAGSEALVTKDKSKAKTKVNGDLIVSVAQEVENLTESKAFGAVPELISAGGEADFRLGGVLARIQAAGWLGEYGSFEALCSEHFGMHPRKARYLITNYSGLVEKQIPWDTVKGVGWSKLREIIGVLTPKNAASWAKKAEKLSAVQLIEEVRKAKAKGDTSGGGNVVEKEITTMSFKVHKDQKPVIREGLDKMKKEAGTDVDTVALTNIMAGYIGGTVKIEVEGGAGGVKSPGDFKTKKAQVEYVQGILEAFGSEIVFKAIEKAWDKYDIKVQVPDDLPDGYGDPKPVEEEED